MTLKINGRTTAESLSDRFDGDGKLLADVSSILTFAAVASSGEPLSVATGLALIVKTAGSVLGASARVLKRLDPAGEKHSHPVIPPYDQFRAIYYIACQRCLVDAVSHTVSGLSTKPNSSRTGAETNARNTRAFVDQLKFQIAAVDEAEITYLFCVEPLSGNVPLFDAFEKWLTTTLAYYGLPELDASVAARNSAADARKRFDVFLASSEPQAVWIRNYLCLARERETSARIAGDLTSIRETLDKWTAEGEKLKHTQQKAWEGYRASLATLPDLRETMFGEPFGVRKVFVQPSVHYHIRGADGYAGRAQPVAHLARLLGALVSERVSGEDLIILCGGPGSGKSTLCRVVASELAQHEQIHPVFLRLRRVKEGAEISQFIEDSLQKVGLIARLTDLREIANLVFILDGFDELVMASRSRLRHFFNVLREDLGSGPLRNAKVIVSGRDTLFPQGEGLPNGSHVISLQPFDKRRVKTWGTKWRLLHKDGQGSSFHPESFVNEVEGEEGSRQPLHHLVSWPLTLHLVARVHTAGKLEVRSGAAKKLEKAYLYRSILAETSHRQLEQAEGTGRLDPRKMREFLRALAWEMHSRSIDSMDPSEAMPILRRFYPDKHEQDLAELAEVAVVNAPELTKGEETGFEFVHKSFAEFLVGEKIADLTERIAFKAPEYGSSELSWRMSELDASNELAPVFGVRPLPAEVQEMFEPMLGCFAPFSKGDRVDEVVTASHRKDGLLRVVERFEMVLDAFLRGKTVDVVGKVANVGHRTQNLLDVHANYVAGILIVGTAASRQLRRFGDKPTQRRQFSGEPFRGAFWRCVSVLTAGGVALDDVLAARLFDGMVVAAEDRESQISELDSPLRVGVLSRVDGFRSRIATSLSECLQYVTELELAVTLLQAALTPTMHMPYTIDRLGYLGGSPHRESRNPLRKFVAELVTHGMAPDALMSNEDDTIRYARHLLEEIAVRSRHSKSDAHEIYARFDDVFRMLMSRARPSTWRVLEETYRTVRRFRETPALSPRKRPRATGSSTKDGESSGR